MSRPLASILVCTRNRGAVLSASCRATIASLPPAGWELVITDNGSTDDTRAAAEELARSDPQRVRVVVEPRPGLSRARNAAIAAAQGELLLFLDDDAVPTAEWFGSLVAALEDDDVFVAGGPVEPVYDAPLPPWLGERFLPYLSVWDLGPRRLDLLYNEYPRGANLGMRREVVARYGGFHPQLGRKGRSLRSCEEIELCLRVERGGHRILYEPSARVRHEVRAARLTEAWLLARFRAQGFSEALMEWRHGGAAALRVGLGRSRRHLRESVAASGPAALASRCQSETFRGYARGATIAPLLVGRWRRDRRGRSPAAWVAPA